MRRTWISAVGVTLLFSIVIAAQNQSQDRASRLQQAHERLDLYVAREMKAQGIPGMSLALTDRNGLLRVSTYGYADTKLGKPVTPDTEFEIGSISKSFTAISLLQLSEEGKYDPRQPITKYLPWFSIHSKYAPITGHEVMTHTAGLPRDRDDVPSSLYQAAGVRDRWTGYPPGKHYAYSNVGYQIMGYLVGEITQETLGDTLRKRILQPLGMTHTEPMFTHDTYSRLATGYSLLYDDRPYSRSAPLVEATWLEYAAGDGSIVSTASDMAAYLRMLLNRGAGPNGRTLSEKSYELLTQRAIKTGLGENTYYGYGIVTRTIEGHTYIGHNGGMVGYSSAMEGDLDGGYGVVALVNWPGGPGGVPEYALKLLRAVYEGKDLPPLPEEEDPTRVKNATDYAGTYTTPAGKKLTLVAEGEKLLLARNGRQIALEQRARDSFYIPHP